MFRSVLALIIAAAPAADDPRARFAAFAARNDPDLVCDANAVAGLWSAVEAWTLAALAGEPALSAPQLVSRIEAIEDAPDAERKQLSATAVRLDASTVAVGFTWVARGIFEVLSEDPSGTWHVAWRISGLAEQNLPKRNELGRWAWCLRGIHDGPLDAKLLEASPDTRGRPRFLVWAHANPAMGGDWPTQLSLWTWTGKDAEVQFIKGAVYAVDFEWDLRRVGPQLEVHTKEPMKSFFACGMCSELESSWTLELTPKGLTDRGRQPLTPELALADALIDRVRRHAPATPVERSLQALLTGTPALPASLGMPVWSLTKVDAKTAVLHLSADELDPLDFTIVTRADRQEVTAVTRAARH